MNTAEDSLRDGASFRDPDGFVYRRGGALYRRINESGVAAYDMLMNSGLYAELTSGGMLVEHEEIEQPTDALGCKTIKPREITFMSYPYGWCFSQLKDAALLTLEIQKHALARGMTLKDASAYNVQFDGARPVFIDTLSFEPYAEGAPWTAYGQFCRHFLAPLSLISKCDPRLGRLLLAHIDGIPLDLASKMLPASTKLDPSLLMHIHAHAKAAVREFSSPSAAAGSRKMSRNSFLGLLDSLSAAVAKLRLTKTQSEWSAYYSTDCDPGTLDAKKTIVAGFLEQCSGTLWDIGCNTGEFSILAAERGFQVLAIDSDVTCIETLYGRLRGGSLPVTPITADLTNPTPAIGWENSERTALKDRGPAGTVLALALIHHLAIGNNIPLGNIASFFSRLCDNLIIEFVPKNDPQARRLLTVREDIFHTYTEESFRGEFGKHFTIRAEKRLPGGERTLFMMKSNGMSGKQ